LYQIERRVPEKTPSNLFDDRFIDCIWRRGAFSALLIDGGLSCSPPFVAVRDLPPSR
jgi:hypothetical protein